MAKKVTGYVKLQIPAGKATPAPPVGTALGPHGVNIMDFCKNFNAKTAKDEGLVIPVVVTIYADRSYSFITKTPPASVLTWLPKKYFSSKMPRGVRMNLLVVTRDTVDSCNSSTSAISPTRSGRCVRRSK